MHWRIRQGLDELRYRLEDRLLSLTIRRIPLPPSVARRRVLLVGASVGRAWRIHLVFPRIRALAGYTFDKTALLRRAIATRPDAIILKECAAYFPDGGVDRELVPRWLDEIRAARIRPVLATVVPVTHAHAASAPGRAEAIRAFNDFLRELAGARQISLLDLEAAVRCSEEDRHLDDSLDAGDGLHLAPRTYRERLDPLIPPLLLQTFG